MTWQWGLQAAYDLRALFNRTDNWATANPAAYNHTEQHCVASVERHCDAYVFQHNVPKEERMRLMHSRAYITAWLDARTQADHCDAWPALAFDHAIRCSIEMVDSQLQIDAKKSCGHDAKYGTPHG